MIQNQVFDTSVRFVVTVYIGVTDAHVTSLYTISAAFDNPVVAYGIAHYFVTLGGKKMCDPAKIAVPASRPVVYEHY